MGITDVAPFYRFQVVLVFPRRNSYRYYLVPVLYKQVFLHVTLYHSCDVACVCSLELHLGKLLKGIVDTHTRTWQLDWNWCSTCKE